MMQKPFSLLLLSAALSSAAAQAASLAWEPALQEAAAHNSDLRKASEDLRQADMDLRVARAAFLPSASASASLGQGGSYQADGVPGTFGAGQNSSSARLSASYTLFNGFGDLASLASAQAAMRSTEAAMQAARASVSFQLRSAFLDLLQAQERETQARDTAKRRADNVDLVQMRFTAGLENKGSLLQTQAQAAQADADAAKATRARRRSAEELGRLMGRDPAASADLEAAGVLETPALPEQGSLKVDALPSVEQALSARESAEQALRKQKGTWLPTLGASASVGRSGGDWLSEDGSWSAGLSLSLPLFTGGSRLAQTLQASSRLDAARIAEQAARDQAYADLRSAYDALADAVDAAQVQAKFLEAGEVRAEVAQAQYAQGLLGFTDWDLVETDRINAQQQALSTRGDAQRALAAWDKALGRSDLP
jgi:outer membrane protein TolC